MNTATTLNASKLTEYDFVLLIDASGSMSEAVKAGASRTRWDAVQETAASFGRDLAALDSDGIDIVIFGGSNVQSFQGIAAADIKSTIATRSPRGSTPLADALTAGLKLAGKSDKKDFIIVFTDGVPDDQAAAAKVIVEASNLQETDDALTILFVQVGDDASATSYLRQLDDALPGAKFDIVDAKTVAEAEAFATTAELVLAAIDD